MTKEEILEKVKNVVPEKGRNIMGCSESWYNCFYALKETFTIEELDSMSEKELNNLITLASAIQEALW